MDKTLNIAHCVESYEPAKGGMPEVVKQLSERMVQKGHTVTVFTSLHSDRKGDSINGVQIKSLINKCMKKYNLIQSARQKSG